MSCPPRARPLAALACGLALALAACGPQDAGAAGVTPAPAASGSPTSGSPQADGLLQFTGMADVGPDGAALCMGAQWTDLPAVPRVCGGLALDVSGVDVTGWSDLTSRSSLPGAERQVTVQTVRATFVGRLAGATFRLERLEPYVEAQLERPTFEDACPDPRAGAAPAGTPTPQDAAIALADAESAWVWVSDQERVLNVATAGPPEDLRARIREVYAGPLCVVGALRTVAQAQAGADGAAQTLRESGVQVFSWSVSSPGRGEVEVAYAPPEQVEALRHAVFPELDVVSWLRPVSPDR